MRRSTVALLLAPAILFLLFGFVAPIAVGLGESLRAGLGLYGKIFGDAYYLEVIASTLALSAVVTLLSLVIGYPYALILARARGWRKAALLLLLVAPLLVNVVVRSFGWMVVFGRSGLINAVLAALGLPTLDMLNSWTAIVIALVHVLMPFMVLLSLHGAVTGSILVFALCMGSFVTVMMMGGNSTMVLPLLIYQQLSVAGDQAFAAALGMVLLATVLAVFWLQGRAVGKLRP
jgi:ABC-type spermidine/putrescine transport system permease subunit I